MSAEGSVQTAVVGLPAAVAVSEAGTILIDRATLVTPGTAADVLRVRYNGGRAFYVNEFGCGRSRDPVGDQVAFRCQCHSSDNGTAQNIFEVALADNTVMFSVDALGDSRVTRDLVLGRNLVYSNAWTAPASYGVGIAGSVGAPYYDVGSRLEAGGRVFLRGRIVTSTAVTYVADATIATFAVGHRPAATVLYTLRSQGTGAANGTVSVTSGGLLSFSTGITLAGGQTASWQLDGLSFPAAA